MGRRFQNDFVIQDDIYKKVNWVVKSLWNQRSILQTSTKGKWSANQHTNRFLSPPSPSRDRGGIGRCDSFAFCWLNHMSIPNLAFCAYSAEDRSGPGILRSHPVRFTRLWRDYLYCDPDLYASGVLSHWCLCPGLSQGCSFMISLKPAMGSNGVVCPY